jgi:hypothetical protein
MYEVGIDINGATEGRTSPARVRRNARPDRRANEQRDVSQNAAYCTALHVGHAGGSARRSPPWVTLE